MDQDRHPLKVPAVYFEGETGSRIEAKIEKVFAALGVVGDDPDLDTLTDASVVIELALTALLARYSFGVDHFAQGVAMMLKRVAKDAAAIIFENAPTA